MINITLAKKLISEQFPEYAHLAISDIKQQGHDNRTYRLGEELLIRMPTTEKYALKIPLEHALLPQLAKHLHIPIPTPIKIGTPSADYPHPFAVYKWISGQSANQLTLDDTAQKNMASNLATFLKALQAITNIDDLQPGEHNWWRGDHVSVYDAGAREQIANLAEDIDSNSALELWERACSTKWHKKPVWIHGDFSAGNILIDNNQLSGVIDFGGTAQGDPACDLVIAWTYLRNPAREIFIDKMNLDDNTH